MAHEGGPGSITEPADFLESMDALVKQRQTETGERMLQWFLADHLPGHLRPTSRVFQQAALRLVERLPRNPERTVMLRKLLEAKDCAVRSQLEG